VNLSSSTVLALIATLAVGALVAVQPPINAELGRRTTDLAAAFVSAAVTLLVLGTIFFVVGDPSSLRQLSGVPVGYLAGGVCGAAFVGVSLVTVRHLGAAGLVAATIAAQLTVAAILDAAGVLGLDGTPLTPLRLLGIAALFAGVALLTFG
jgi:transporter family-2 protein